MIPIYRAPPFAVDLYCRGLTVPANSEFHVSVLSQDVSLLGSSNTFKGVQAKCHMFN